MRPEQSLWIVSIQDVRAIGSMDSDSAAPSHVSNDCIAVHRLAAGGEVRQKIAHAHDIEPKRRLGFGNMRRGGEHFLCAGVADPGRDQL